MCRATCALVLDIVSALLELGRSVREDLIIDVDMN